MKFRRIIIVAILIGLFLAVLFSIGYYFLFANRGGVFLVEKALPEFTDLEDINIEKSQGSISDMMSIEDLELDDLEWLPKGSVLKAKRLDIELISFFPFRFSAKVHQGSLKIPDIPSVIFYGSYENSELDMNIYAKGFNLSELSDFFPQNGELKRLFGSFEDIDIDVKGTLNKPEISGSILVKDFRRDQVRVSECPIVFNLVLTDVKKSLKINGEVLTNSGSIFGKKTAVITLLPGKIIFEGDYSNPVLDLVGKTEVEKVKIGITLKGTLTKPELKLLSDSVMSQERLLIMLATGKKWKGADDLTQSGKVSADLAADFLDYFVFSGKGSKMIEKLGISELSFHVNKVAAGVTLKKDVIGKIAVTYGIEKSSTTNGSISSIQSVGGEYKVTDNVSVGVERKIEGAGKPGRDKVSSDENKVKLEFKKKF